MKDDLIVNSVLIISWLKGLIKEPNKKVNTLGYYFKLPLTPKDYIIDWVVPGIFVLIITFLSMMFLFGHIK